MEAVRIGAMVSAAAQERESTLSDDDITVSSKLDSYVTVFREVKLTSDRIPDGQRIGYRFVRLIAQGASSRVYLAERFSDRMTLVLKIMDVATIKEPQAVQRFV